MALLIKSESESTDSSNPFVNWLFQFIPDIRQTINRQEISLKWQDRSQLDSQLLWKIKVDQWRIFPRWKKTKKKNLKQCFESEDEEDDSFGEQLGVIQNKNKVRHQKRSVTPKKRFKCDECGKSFTDHFYISAHKRVHTGEKPYHCDDCEKAFRTNSNLIIHKQIHSIERAYPCNLCEKSFKQKQSLKGHKVRCHVVKNPQYVTKVHDTTYNFPCEECLKRFTTRSSLKTHKRIHTGEKQFSCDQCDKSFTVKCNLQNHQRRHH